MIEVNRAAAVAAYWVMLRELGIDTEHNEIDVMETIDMLSVDWEQSHNVVMIGGAS